ncbi:hypothetical protein Tco_0138127 [Tanacetum coccineum]
MSDVKTLELLIMGNSNANHSRSEWFMGNDRATRDDSIRQQKDKTAIAFLYQALPEEQLLQTQNTKPRKPYGTP